MNSEFSGDISREYNEDSVKRSLFLKSLPKGSHIHISGVCGTGTASVLSLLKKFGFYVSGSDKAFYPPMGDIVKELADEVFEGYSASNLNKMPSMVVIGNALSRGNPEIEFILENKIPFCSMPEVFSALLIGDRTQCANSVVVSGTHGKTTTSSLIASILTSSGKRPGYFIGGAPSGNILKGSINLPSTEIPASERIVVLEGDEYDSAFFAKYSKFHAYRPDIAILTNIEFDHGDIFEDLEAIKKEFRKFLNRVPEDGAIVVCKDSNVAFNLSLEITKKPNTPKLITYGTDPSCDIYLKKRVPIEATKNDSNASVHVTNTENLAQVLYFRAYNEDIKLNSPLLGIHNALNIAAMIGVCNFLGISYENISKGLLEFSPIKRRQQLIASKNNIFLIEDFAHHPTEVKVTLQGIKEAYPNNRLLVVFEPRSNTSRRAFFRDEYKEALSVADFIFVKEIKTNPSETLYSGVSSTKPLFEVSELIELLNNSNKKAYSSSEIPELFSLIKDNIQEGDTIVVMSNGDFGGIITMIKEFILNP